MILCGTQNLQIIFSHKNFSTLICVMLATTSILTHFVKYSQATMKNSFWTLANGKEPKISNPYYANSLGAVMLDRSSGGCCGTRANF